ncbi:phage late control D family protein [Poseidonocella sp. HB161398]|uniref:phage late control D family protein n=1 Tax=Poseidonocella sp. HB161398 TaxID=2320855 RepID=UPI00110A090D|nr:contractile injection system protein, VgrG/Pvc8 family [Poseidonocella sp. HB161398]
MPEDQLYDAVIVDTRPVIEVAGAQHDMIPELLVAVEVCERECGLSHAEILLLNSTEHAGAGLGLAFEHSETNLFPLGETLRVLTGDAADPTEIFRGMVSAVSFEMEDGDQPRLRVFAEDALMSWRMVRRNRTFAAGPLRDLLRQLARDTGLSPVITGLNEEVDEQQQLNETDLAFLQRLARRYDFDAQVVAEELHLSPRAAVDRGTVTLALGQQLRDVRVTADLAHQRGATEVHGLDIFSGAVKSVRSGSLTALGPGAGATGPEEVDRVFPGTRVRLPDTDFANETEAQAVVDAAQTRRARGFVLAEGRAVGNAAIRVGTVVTLEELGPRFSNDYYVTRVRHSFDQRAGLVSEFSAECAYFGRV